MAARDIAVAGASAGGVYALQELARGLPADYAGSLLVVLHIGKESPGMVPEILSWAGPLPASNAADGEKIRPGRIYVAPPDHHLLVDGDARMRLSRGPRENFARPAVDPLFRSAAVAFRERVVGVILTGGLDDGASGLYAIKQAGGLAVVQDPAEAEVPSMPISALRQTRADYCLRLAQIPPLLAGLAREEVTANSELAVSRDLELEVAIAAGRPAEEAVELLGNPSRFACPECHGVLSRIRDDHPPRFRCQTGHGYTAAALEALYPQQIEASLWKAVRSLEEYAALLREVAAGRDGEDGGEKRARAERELSRAEAIRRVLRVE